MFLSPDEDLRRFARAYDSSYVEDDMHGENGQEMSRRDRLRSPTGLGTVSVSFENSENNEHNMYDTKQRRPTRKEDSVTNKEEGRRRNRRREEGSNAVSVFASSGPSTISGSFSLTRPLLLAVSEELDTTATNTRPLLLESMLREQKEDEDEAAQQNQEEILSSFVETSSGIMTTVTQGGFDSLLSNDNKEEDKNNSIDDKEKDRKTYVPLKSASINTAGQATILDLTDGSTFYVQREREKQQQQRRRHRSNANDDLTETNPFFQQMMSSNQEQERRQQEGMDRPKSRPQTNSSEWRKHRTLKLISMLEKSNQKEALYQENNDLVLGDLKNSHKQDYYNISELMKEEMRLKYAEFPLTFLFER